MKGRHWILLLFVSLTLLAASFFFFLGSFISLFSPYPSEGNVAVIEILGGIFESKEIVESIRKIRDEDKVKAVVLRIDSPGGSIGASQDIFDAVKKLREKKPVVASMGKVAASGGYYVALPANKIVANPGTVTGSIGVRMEMLNVEDLMRWAMLKPMTLKSGSLKDIGSPTRPMTGEEREVLEKILQEMHRQFKVAVSEGRSLSLDEVEKLADGRIFTGTEALQKKMIDELGSLERAEEIAATLAGIKGRPKVFYPDEKGDSILDFFLDSLVGRFSSKLMTLAYYPVRILY